MRFLEVTWQNINHHLKPRILYVCYIAFTEADLLPTIQSITPTDNVIVRAVATSADVFISVELQEGSSFPGVSSLNKNFNISFVLSKTSTPGLGCQGSWENCEFMPLPSVISEEILQSGINTTNSANLTFVATLNLLVPPEHCSSVQYLCIHLTEGFNSSYIELNSTDNLHCQNVSSLLLCKPGRLLVNVFLQQAAVPYASTPEHFFTLYIA